MNRSYVETLNFILTLSVKGIRKKEIIMNANLSPEGELKFINFLISTDLLSEEASFYKTTYKGLCFIKDFGKIQSSMTRYNRKHGQNN